MHKNNLTTLCYIEKDDCYLMMHRVSKKNDINAGKWIGVGGHFEDNESPEDCLLREVKEETGLTVKNLRYVSSQPWGFSESLLFGFWCDVDGDPTISLDTDELTIAQWKNSEDEFDILDDVSLTATMIQMFKNKGVHYGQ